MKLLKITFVAGMCLVGLWVLFREHSGYRLHIRTYFKTAQNLRPGATVRVDGVEVGSITSVRLTNNKPGRPIEVVMTIRTPYKIGIPADSVGELTSDGVLGPEIVAIRTQATTREPIADYGVIDNEEYVDDDRAADAMEKMGNILINESKTIRQQYKSSVPPSSL